MFNFLIPLLMLCSCTGGQSSYKTWMTPNGKVKVLSTIAMIDDVVKQVGGEYVDTTPLIKGELDPHSYQLVKGDDEKLAFADLIFYNGLGLEHGPSLQRYLQTSAKAVGLGDQIQKSHPELILSYRGQLDPHIWMDADLWSKTVPQIVAALSAKDPTHAEAYASNGQKLLNQMSDLHHTLRKELQAIPALQRYLVTSHDAFNYFTRAYLAEEAEWKDGSWQNRFAAPEGLAPDSQLGAADIQAIIHHLQEYNIHVLFPESNVSRDSIRKIVNAGQETGLHLKIAADPLYADAMGPPGSDADTYLKMIAHNAQTIAYYLWKNYP
jgi:manganese/zinc/iron transport system substrate-binding protein